MNTERSHAADGGEAIPIALDPRLVEVFDLSRAHGLDILLAGGTARRMVLGMNPLDPAADLDIIVSPHDGNPWLPRKLLASFRTSLRTCVRMWVDVLNADANRSYPRYEKFGSSNAPSLNRLLIKHDAAAQVWSITDSKGGTYLDDVRRKRLVLVENRPGRFTCDLRDALNFIRLMLECPELEIDPASLQLVRDFCRAGKVSVRGQEMTFSAYMGRFFQADAEPGAVNIPRNPFLSLFSVFIHAREIDGVVPFLEAWGLAEAFGQRVDLRKTTAIVSEKRSRDEPVTHTDFDDTFLWTPPGSDWTGLFTSTERFQDFLVAELRESLRRDAPLLTTHVRRFAEEFLCDLLPAFNQTVVVNRVSILRNTCRLLRTYCLSDRLDAGWDRCIAVFLPEAVSRWIARHEDSIREGVNAGHYLNFLDYWYRNGSTT